LNLGHGRRDQGPSAEPDDPVAKEAAMAVPYETQRPIVSDNMLAVAVYLVVREEYPSR